MEARVTKLARVSPRFSKSLARRRFRPNQEKVRSTTQRRGRTTKPFMSSLRLRFAFAAASTCHSLLPPSAQISSSQGKHRRILSRTKPGPVAVLDRGGVDHDPHWQPFAIDQGA